MRDTLKKILINSAEDQINPADPAGWDATYGHGRVNAYRALLSVIHGDVNNDGSIDPLDVTQLVNFTYRLCIECIPQPERCVGDCNCDNYVDHLDVAWLIHKVFVNPDFDFPICFDYF